MSIQTFRLKETLCFGGVSQLRGQDVFAVSRGGWMGLYTGKFWATTSVPQWEHWKWIVDGSSNMTMTQNIRPRQQRSGSKISILRSWSGLASFRPKFHRQSVEGPEAPQSDSLGTLRIWRGSAKRSEPKSLPRSVQTCWKTTTNVWPLCLPTKVSPPSIKSYCSIDQTLISCENMIINIQNLYNVVIFYNILSLNVKMYLWLKLHTVPFFVSGQTYKISKESNNYCSHCILMFNIC